MNYRRLTPSERYQIEAMLKSGSSFRAIAREINRSPSSVVREVGERANYSAETAVAESLESSSSRKRSKFKIKGKLRRKIVLDLKKQWSPEQIVGRLKLTCHNLLVSPQSIYRFIERDKQAGGKLQKELRQLRKERADRKAKAWLPPNERRSKRVMITHRPKVVEKRKRLGDYERDTVHGAFGKPMLLTLVDRTSRLTKIERIERRTTELVHSATVKALKNEVCFTITNDNGSEFERHQKTAKVLRATIYFAHAYRSWERGTNENTNGLIRQYFPRKKDLSHYSPRQIKRVERLLNNRPRKCLGFKTPREVHNELRSKVLR